MIVLALGAGFGAAGMSGDAARKGKLPFAQGVSPIAISLTNGLAVFVLVLLLRDWILPTADNGNRLELLGLVGEVAGEQPERIMVSAEYDGMAVGPDSRLILVICRDPLCQDFASRATVDEPAFGLDGRLPEGAASIRARGASTA